MNATAHDRRPDTAPIDVETIISTAQEVISDGAKIEDPDELGTIILLLRGVIELLVPEIEIILGGRRRDDVPAVCARACLGEARARLRMGEGDTAAVRLSVAQKLARCSLALAEHYKRLGEPS